MFCTLNVSWRWVWVVPTSVVIRKVCVPSSRIRVLMGRLVGKLVRLDRPRAIEHASYLKALPALLWDYLLTPDLSDRRKRVQALMELLDQQPMAVVERAVASALEYKRTDVASLLAFAAHAADQGAPAPVEEPWTPSEVAQWQANLGDYDRLVTNHG